MRNTENSSAAPAVDKPARPAQTYSRRRAVLTNLFLAPGAGLAASLMATLSMGLLLLLAGIPSPVELFGDFTLKHINVDTFLKLLISFSPNSKTTPLGLALLGMIAIGTVLALLYAGLVGVQLPVQTARPGRRECLVAGALALALSLLGIGLFWNELRQNHFGLPIPWATFLTALGLLVDFSVYGLILCLTYRALLPKASTSETSVVQSRRQLLSRAGVATLTLGAGAGTAGVIRGYLNNFASYDGTKAYSKGNVTAPITPNNEHYVVTQNVVDPAPITSQWRLEVQGLVNRAGTYTYEEVQALPSISRAVTLECIANGVGDHLMSTAIWQGITLQTLLKQHGGAQSGATHVAFYSVDGYNMSLPLAEVLEADALLAWRMNGAALPERHGYPMRVLIPGRYGEENPKWLTRVELTDHFVGGLYSDQGWYNGPLHAFSRIDHPQGQVAVDQSVEVGGIAFAGNRGIQRVEVSTDGGSTWQQATLKPPLSQDAWVFWSWQWTPRQTGSYTLVCRATDGTGELQTSQKQNTVPNGATGYHKVTVQVS